MPALFIKMSRRLDSEVTWWAALDMDLKDERSSGRYVIFAKGYSFLMEDTAASPFEGVRAAR